MNFRSYDHKRCNNVMRTKIHGSLLILKYLEKQTPNVILEFVFKCRPIYVSQTSGVVVGWGGFSVYRKIPVFSKNRFFGFAKP